jgi:hypothetical protein
MPVQGGTHLSFRLPGAVVRANACVGSAIYYGIDVEISYAEAFRFLSAAAEQRFSRPARRSTQNGSALLSRPNSLGHNSGRHPARSCASVTPTSALAIGSASNNRLGLRNQHQDIAQDNKQLRGKIMSYAPSEVPKSDMSDKTMVAPVLRNNFHLITASFMDHSE